MFDHIDIPDGGFPVIAADNPWEFKTRSAKGKAGRPQHYERMTLAEMMAMPVAALAAKDCHLFFWTTAPHLPQSFKVMRAWGFEYSSMAFVWVKLRARAEVLLFRAMDLVCLQDLFMGQGYTTRKNAEYCLLGRRGRPKRKSKSVRDVIVSPVREHSRKPDEFYERVQAYAAGPYIELFSRSHRPGWKNFGDEVGKFDV